MKLFATLLILLMATSSFVYAQKEDPCIAQNTDCLMTRLTALTAEIQEPRWRDQTYRELAKLMARSKNTDGAITLLDKIENADTKALTIRGIGMNAVDAELDSDLYPELFQKLTAEAQKIDHPPSHAIALTYIAMAQAFAGDDKGAMMTAKSMENDALRNKAFGESAEIQAERGNLTAAIDSIAAIEDKAFRNKAHKTISKIFADRQKYDEALAAAEKIDNEYQHAQAILYILAKQISPEEVKLR